MHRATGGRTGNSGSRGLAGRAGALYGLGGPAPSPENGRRFLRPGPAGRRPTAANRRRRAITPTETGAVAAAVLHADGRRTGGRALPPGGPGSSGHAERRQADQGPHPPGSRPQAEVQYPGQSERPGRIVAGHERRALDGFRQSSLSRQPTAGTQYPGSATRIRAAGLCRPTRLEAIVRGGGPHFHGGPCPGNPRPVGDRRGPAWRGKRRRLSCCPARRQRRSIPSRDAR